MSDARPVGSDDHPTPEDDPSGASETPVASRRRSGTLGLVLAVVFFLIAAGIALAVFRGLAESVEVPDVRNISQEKATAALNEAGLKTAVGTSSILTAYPPDWVVAQTPAPGTRVKAETTVTLSVANPSAPKPTSGPADAPDVVVPNVVGMPWTDATKKLEAVGLTALYVYSNSSQSVPNGDVVRQTPAGGKSVKKGSAVSLTVSLSSTANPDLPNGELPPNAGN